MALEQPTIAARRGALEILPSKLGDAYEQTVQRIQTSSDLTNLGMRVLMWLHLATRPLKLEELQNALAVVLEKGKRGNVDLDEDQIPKPKRLLDCCLGLVVVDEETLTVRFVHYTLEEYFKTHFNTYFPNGHSTAAEVCLTYLNFGKLIASSNYLTPDDMKRNIHQWPFLEYAACQWGCSDPYVNTAHSSWAAKDGWAGPPTNRANGRPFINGPSPPINLTATTIFKYNYLIYTGLLRNTGLWSTTDK